MRKYLLVILLFVSLQSCFQCCNKKQANKQQYIMDIWNQKIKDSIPVVHIEKKK